MSDRATVAVELLCVLAIAAGIVAEWGWPIAVIVGCALLLTGMQGFGRRDEEAQ